MLPGLGLLGAGRGGAGARAGCRLPLLLLLAALAGAGGQLCSPGQYYGPWQDGVCTQGAIVNQPTSCIAACTGASPVVCTPAKCLPCPAGRYQPATFALNQSSIDVNAAACSVPCLWHVSTLAGNGSALPFADGAGTLATFASPSGVAIAASGLVYVADKNNSKIRAVTPGGSVSTIAGGNMTATGWADGIGASAAFSGPYAVAVHPTSGEIYCADTGNHRIRKITVAGVTTTLAGSGGGTWADGAGTLASFWAPSGIAVDITTITACA